MAETAQAAHADHFASLAVQTHAARLGTWIFLASEALLFAGLFALYAAYRSHFGGELAAGVEHNDKLLGSLNTLILLTSSFTIASSTLALARGRRLFALALVVLTLLLAAAFLAVKGVEYARHYAEGIELDAAGRFFDEHGARGLSLFFLLYYLMTGLHALHVVAGMGVLAWLALLLATRRLSPARRHPLELGALYWHFVDVVWIFLWPLFYLTGGAG